MSVFFTPLLCLRALTLKHRIPAETKQRAATRSVTSDVVVETGNLCFLRSVMHMVTFCIAV